MKTATHLPVLIVAVLMSALGQRAAGAVTHPNLVLNETEIAEIRQKVQTEKWAGAIVQRMKREVEAQDEKEGFRLSAAVLYAITRETKYADVAYSALAVKLEEWKRPQTQYIWEIGGEEAIIYDLIWDHLQLQAREEIEQAMRVGARHAIEFTNSKRQTWNMFWIMHAQVGMMGFVTGDRELMEWGLNDPGGGSFEKAGHKRYGGFYEVMEGCTKDGAWAEPNAYAYYIVLPHILALAEAARHYDGTDLWAWKSPKGNSIKDLFDAALARAYPAEDAGADGVSYRLASFGDAGTQSGGDFWLANLPGVTTGGHRWRFDLSSLFDVAYRRTGDTRYGWVATRNAARDIRVTPLGYFGLLYGRAVDAQKIDPPLAPSTLMPYLGMALLRADESPTYWSGKGLAVFFMMGAEVGHEHQDLHEIMLHANGRLVYVDIDSYQYEDDSKIGWTQRPIAHNTLTVDGATTSVSSDLAGEREQKFIWRNAFFPEVKFVLSSAKPWQKPNPIRGNAPVAKQVWPMNVTQTRALFVTREYVVDFLRADGDREHIYDWAMHGFGHLETGAGFEPSSDLEPYRWIKDVRVIKTSASWAADWVQEDGTGVKMNMLGEKGSSIYVGEGPYSREDMENGMKQKPPGFQGRIPVVVVRRAARSTIFAAVHQPFANRPDGSIRSIRLVQQNEDAICVQVVGDGWTDYCMVNLADAEKPVQIDGDKEHFRFKNFAYIRSAANATIQRGGLDASAIK